MTLVLLGALAVGLTLGLLGSGGSILTVPVLTLVVGQHEKVAIASSLAIVGGIAAFAALRAWREGSVDGPSVLGFGLPGMVGSYGGAWLGGLVDGQVQLFVFAGLLLAAGRSMLRPAESRESSPGPRRSLLRIGLDGLGVGLLTGFVGVGGGFLIVPALGALGGLPLATAVGTSLAIITLKSAAGLAKAAAMLAPLGLALDWTVIGAFVAVGIAGTLAGQGLGRALPEARVRQAFAVLLLAVGSLTLAQGAWRLRAASDHTPTSASAAVSQVPTSTGSHS